MSKNAFVPPRIAPLQRVYDEPPISHVFLIEAFAQRRYLDRLLRHTPA